MKKAMVLFLMIACFGCVSIGAQVNTDQLASFRKGETTITDVISKLGKPTSTLTNSDGTKTLQYMYVRSQARPETFIPLIGGFVGGADTKSNLVSLRFDSSGKLLDFISSETQLGTGTGIAGGPYHERTQDQPREAQ